ncbi:hypothetical protein AZ046_002004, partial [Klebsiella pneumoniae]
SRHPAKLQVPCLISYPAALRLRGPARFEPGRGPVGRARRQPPPGIKPGARYDKYPDLARRPRPGYR